MVFPLKRAFYAIKQKSFRLIKDLALTETFYLFAVEIFIVDYQKYYYWVKPSAYETNIEKITMKLPDVKIRNAESRQCEALYPSYALVVVKPEVWSANCYRQGSWFRTSELKDMYLIVSNQPLDFLTADESGKIAIVKLANIPDFRLDESFIRKIEALNNHPRLKERAPPEWFHLLDREVPLFEAFIRSRNLGVDLTTFLKIHTAGHALFLIEEKDIGNYVKIPNESDQEVPCSMCPEEFVCSACLEIFGVLGRSHKKLLVKRCPGLKYLKLERNEYLLISKNSNG